MKYLLFLIFFSSTFFAQDWKEYKLENGNFTINMPGEPVQQTREVESDIGKLELHLLILDLNTSAYIASYVDYPESSFELVNIDSVLNGARDGALKNTNSELINDKKIELNGYNGKEFFYKTNTGIYFTSRIVLVSNRLYNLTFGSSELNIEEVVETKFFDSFQLTKNAHKTSIEKLLEEIGYTYTKNEKNAYEFTLKYKEDRTQMITITPIISEYTNKEQYEIWSYVGFYKDSIDFKIIKQMFELNGNSEIGHFQSYKSKEEDFLVYSNVFHGKIDVEILTNLIYNIGFTADKFEKEITNKDDY